MAEKITFLLNDSNYSTWKLHVKMILMEKNLWGIVDGSEVPPSLSDVKEYKNYCLRKEKALANIVLAVDPKIYYILGDPKDPQEAWMKIQNQYEGNTFQNRFKLRNQLYHMRLNENEDMNNHIKNMTEIFDKLSVMGESLQEEDKVIHILSSLPKSFNVLVTAIVAQEKVPKLEFIYERLKHHSQITKNSENDEQKALLLKINKSLLKCSFCHKKGHIKDNCWSLKNKNKEKGNTKKPNHKANTSKKEDEESAGLIASHALKAKGKGNNLWIIDSGASCHMCKDIEQFDDLEDLNDPIKIYLGDNSTVTANQRGTVYLYTKVEEKVIKIKLHDVLYIPSMGHNLLSVPKASKLGNTIKFSDENCFIYNTKQKLVAKAPKIGNLFYLDFEPNQEILNLSKEKNKEFIWHRRYGHLGEQNLKLIARNNLVEGFDFDHKKDLNFCEPCANGKNQRKQFPKDDEKKSRKPLELIHTDVCGKMNQKSLSDSEYFVTFIDDATRYIWVYFIKNKSEVFEKFILFKNQVEKQFDYKLKTLRSDNGGEYTSKEFQKFLEENGIVHQFTIPKTPEQNGVSERMNRTLVEGVRCMLNDSKLPKCFWAEALSTMAYLRNRSPATFLGKKTPFEALYGNKPSIKHLRIFGCVCYSHIPKDERKKLDDKSKKAILLGYGENIKGYRLFNIETKKIFYSRDVIFAEQENLLSNNNEELFDNQSDEYIRVVSDDASDEHVEDVVENQLNDVPEIPQPIRRSDRIRKPPDHYGEWIFSAVESHEAPRNYKEALKSVNSDKWLSAMESEINSMLLNKVWELVELPKNKNIIDSR